jgi:integral membrane protein (TIGR01906 family)
VNANRGRAASSLAGIAAAVLIIALAIVPFLTPAWVAFEQERANVAAWTGFSTPEIRAATDPILADLVLGGTFTVEVRGQPVLNERERGHMADVRTVFRGLWIVAVGAVIVLIAAAKRGDTRRHWQAVRHSAVGLALGIGIVGVMGLFAFDRLFEIFHELFFPAGSYLFDPATDRLVQLFPFQFWQETAIVVGVVIIVASFVVAAFAGRRARRRVATRAESDRAAVPAPPS